MLGGEGGREKEERRSGEEEKSNNPNLKGGEKQKKCKYVFFGCEGVGGVNCICGLYLFEIAV